MPASSVARSLLSAFLIISRAMAAVSPSNTTLEDSAITNRLRLDGGTLSNGMVYDLAPLTTEMGKGNTIQNLITFEGTARLIDYTTTSNVTSTDVALISCDPNGSNIDASTVVNSAGANKPQGIILYSIAANSCELTSGSTYTSIFTMVSISDAQTMLNMLGQGSTLIAAVGGPTNSSTSGSGSTSGSTTANEGGPAPTTAVAMSILYSITGIITLLFLVIIATGAVRAHRHPERYGPRIGFAGRPRQSRAKGLARAMLETLPIVKFGDPEPVKPNTDVELENGHTRDPSVITGVRAEEINKVTGAGVASGMGAAQAESVHSDRVAAAVVREEDLGCSICTEDFTTGEDVRVLPCNHKYHPACIDPWLLNVSGTCPLCRHDLRPSTSATDNAEGAEGTEGAENDDLPPPLGDEESNNTSSPPHHQSRMSRFVDLRRLRNAPPDERIAALRSLREQTRGEAAVEGTEERSRRSRLRDTFRVRTRNVGSSAPAAT